MTLPLVFVAALIAQAPAAAAPRYERPIAIRSPGPQRLAIDAALLVGSAPFTVVRRDGRAVAEGGLSDLRLTGPDGHEVPYLLVYPPVRVPHWMRADVLPIPATKQTSGFEADLGTAQDVDGIDLRDMPGPFMKRFSLEASADRAHWTVLVPEGTLFDLADRQLRETSAGFPAGSYRYLRVTWDDTHSGRVPLPMNVYARLAVPATPSASAPAVTMPLAFERRASEPGRSRFHIALPASRLPIVGLRLEAGGTYLFRNVTVTEPRLAQWQAAPVPIGEGLLIRDRSSSTPLRVAMLQPSQAEIDVLVEDGDNPPLDLRGVTAEVAELPWIYVDAPGPLVAHYGDATLPRPSYDLEAARPSLQIDALPEAHWGVASVAPAPAAGPHVDIAAMTGGPLDVSSFHYARDIAAGKPELVALPLDAAVLAHSGGPAREFADVRIVDGGGRQVPRLVECRPEPLIVALKAEAASPSALERQPNAGVHRSVYHVVLPYAGLPDARIVITTAAPVFQRHVEIGYERPADRHHRDPWFMMLASAEWSRAEGAPNTLTLPLGSVGSDATQLTIAIDEGDNSALPIAAVQLLLPSYRLRFVRPASAARVVYGNTSIDMPRYDLSLLAPAVLGAAVSDVSMSAEAPTKTAAVEVLISPRMFWLFLVLAVGVLLGVLVRLLRKAA